MPARESMRALRHQRVSRKTQECDPVCGLGVAIRDAQQSRSAVDRPGSCYHNCRLWHRECQRYPQRDALKHGQVLALGRRQDFAGHVVEGCHVLEYDSLP